jgi:hypothetical protein
MLDRFFPASDLAIGEREARLLLWALAGLGLVKADKDGYFSAAIPNLSRSAFIFSQWTRLADVIQADQPPLAMDTQVELHACIQTWSHTSIKFLTGG